MWRSSKTFCVFWHHLCWITKTSLWATRICPPKNPSCFELSWGTGGPVESGGRKCWSSTESESLGTSYHGFDVAPWVQFVEVVEFDLFEFRNWWCWSTLLFILSSPDGIPFHNITSYMIPLVRSAPPPPLPPTQLRWGDTEQHWTIYIHWSGALYGSSIISSLVLSNIDILTLIFFWREWEGWV